MSREQGMARRRNIAAAVGGWSARHRWSALLIWVGFVVVATLAGNAVGTRGMEPWEDDNGQSRKAAMVLDAAGFPDVAGETVLVQAGAPPLPPISGRSRRTSRRRCSRPAWWRRCARRTTRRSPPRSAGTGVRPW
nr:hypothetical protein GCM10020093_080150 [Planobispora longispora]